MDDILSTNKLKSQFAQLIEVNNHKSNQLCSSYYIIWLLRESYCFGDLSIENKDRCLKLAYSLVHDMERNLTALSNGIIMYPEAFCSNWLHILHLHFFNRSRFSR